MTTYTAIADSDIDPESPGNTTLFTRLRDNPISLAEGTELTTYASVTAFTGAGFNYIDDDGDSQGGNFIDIASIIGAAWESVGPTGSGATNIWTALDGVPSTSPFVRLRLATDTIGGGGVALYARRTGSSSTVGIGTLRAQNKSDEADCSFFPVPVDSLNRFDLYQVISGASISRLALDEWGI